MYDSIESPTKNTYTKGFFSIKLLTKASTMCDQVSITSQLLEITKTLAVQNVSFNFSLNFSINKKNFSFNASSLKEGTESSYLSEEEGEISKPKGKEP